MLNVMTSNGIWAVTDWGEPVATASEMAATARQRAYRRSRATLLHTAALDMGHKMWLRGAKRQATDTTIRAF